MGIFLLAHYFGDERLSYFTEYFLRIVMCPKFEIIDLDEERCSLHDRITDVSAGTGCL